MPVMEADQQAFSAAELRTKTFEQWQRKQALHKAGVKPLATTGLNNLDRAFQDWLWPGLYIIHGVPGAGKSALASQIAAQCGVPVLYITCELTPPQMFTRLTAHVCNVTMYVLNDKEGIPSIINSYYEKAEKKLDHIIFGDGSIAPALSVTWINQMLHMAAGPEGRTPLLIIDSLHAWAETCADPEVGEYQSINSAISSLRRIISNHNCPIIAISERNRASMQQGGLSAARGSGRIEYVADVVIDLNRDDNDKSRRPEDPVILTARIPKNRFGPQGLRISLEFDPSIMTFRETGY